MKFLVSACVFIAFCGWSMLGVSLVLSAPGPVEFIISLAIVLPLEILAGLGLFVGYKALMAGEL